MPLDVCLNGERDYVQGSQMLAQAARHLADCKGATHLVTATFRRLTARRVAWIDGPAVQDAIGHASFATSNGTIAGYFVECDTPAPRDTLSEHFELAQDQQAIQRRTTVRFNGVQSFDDAIAMIIRVTKAVHERIGPDVRDVWFTGQRGAALPLSPAGIPRSGTLAVAIDRVQGSGSRQQSLCPVTMTGDDNIVLAPLVTFAFSRTGTSHVA